MNFEFLDQLLAKLNSNDNEARKGGEAELAQLWETQPGNVLLGFASLLALHPNPVVIR